MKEYRIIVHTHAHDTQNAVNELTKEGFVLMAPVSAVYSLKENAFIYIATMEREVEPEENE